MESHIKINHQKTTQGKFKYNIQMDIHTIEISKMELEM